MPTLLNRMSTPPNRPTVASTTRLHSDESETSACSISPLAAETLHLGHGGLSRFAVHVGNGDHRPLLGELPSRRLSDAKRAPCDDDNLPAEIRHARLLTVVREASIGVVWQTVKLRWIWLFEVVKTELQL